MMKILFLSLLISFQAFGYIYEKVEKDNHIIHIITLNPKDYNMELVKANNSLIGRETVPSIAERSNATIAINAGFFEIGNSKDGAPSGTLVTQHKIYGLRLDEHTLLMKKDGGDLTIDRLTPELYFLNDGEKISILKVNQQPLDEKDVILFTDGYNKKTLTSFQKRTELVFDKNGVLLEIMEHGNNTIPKDGFVVSLPKSFALKAKDKIKLEVSSLSKFSDYDLALWGFPFLVNKGEIVPTLLDQKSSFYQNAHARTAIGIKPDKTIVLIVAEHAYEKNLESVTFEDIKTLLKSKSVSLTARYLKNLMNLTLKELKDILEKEYAPLKAPKGLSTIELAQFAKSLGCSFALNLDGGGSSTLWVNGKTLNQTFGDMDESNGMKVIRPVSDAIVFRKN